MSKDDSLVKVAEALAKADMERAADLDRLVGLTDDQIAYLAGADSIEDPETDGLEAECI